MKALCTIAGLTAALIALPAAAETGDETSIGRGSSDTMAMEIAEGAMVMRTNAAYESFEVSAGHPLEGATGPCFGAVTIMGGKVSGGGNCVYDTAGGDKAVMQWMATGMTAEGALTGDWTVLGGSGAWANASGGGTFSSLTDPATGMFENTITGAITLQ